MLNVSLFPKNFIQQIQGLGQSEYAIRWRTPQIDPGNNNFRAILSPLVEIVRVMQCRDREGGLMTPPLKISGLESLNEFPFGPLTL